MKTPAEIEEDRQKNCLEKLTWETNEAAIAARIYAGWQYGDSASQPQPYRCRYCRKWHLGSGNSR